MPRVIRSREPNSVASFHFLVLPARLRKNLRGWRLARRIESYYGAVSMQITVNGRSQKIPDGLTVLGLLKHLGMTEGPVAVERNRNVVPRSEHPAVALENDDVLEIVHFVGGG